MVDMHNYYSGWWYTYPLKNMSSSDWIIIPTIGENKSHVPNHQPEYDIHLIYRVTSG